MRKITRPSKSTSTHYKIKKMIFLNIFIIKLSRFFSDVMDNKVTFNLVLRIHGYRIMELFTWI